jgi:putative AlgH/UPF0301 family transcriptional regulator
MPLGKLCFFTILATVVVGFVAPASLNVPLNRFPLSATTSRPHEPALIRDETLLCRRQPMNNPNPRHWVKTFAAKSENQTTVFLPVQFQGAKDLGAGSLLVASRGLADPKFAETVILLVHYDAEGVVGLILNRRTDVPLSRVLEGYKGAKGRSDRVYVGGPLETPALFALLQSTANPEGAEHVFGSVYFISKKALFEQIISARPDPSVFHVYMGYAGWNPHQLRMEVQLGAWFIFKGDAKTIFDSDPDSLWPQMIQKTELEFARVRL